MKLPFLRALGVAALLCLQSLVHAALPLDAPLPIGPQVKVGHLDNGLTYYIQRNAQPERKLELRLVVKAGSILEDENQRGLAHFVEHMAFNGSTHFKKQELVSYLQSLGVRFGADLNAYTSFDETVYILPIPTDRPDNVGRAFQVLEDWAHGLQFDDAAIEKERAIVLEELRLGKGAEDRIGKQIYPRIFNGSRYAERLPIGSEEVLRTFKPETLRRFYRDWYRPDLMAVVIVGDIDPAQAETLVRKHFAHLKNPDQPRKREYATIPERRNSDALVVTDPEASGNAVLIRYPVQPVKEAGTIGAYRADLVKLLFGAMLNQRLADLSQQPDAPWIGASSSLEKLTPRYHAYQASAALGPRGALPAVTALVQENERARQHGFGAQELERAKKNLLRAYENAYTERAKHDSSIYAAEYIRNFLQDEAIPGIEAEYAYVREFLPGISVEEMHAYARQTIPANSGMLALYVGVTRPDVPSGSALLEAARTAARATIAPYGDKQLATELLDKLPKAGRIVSQTHDAKLGLHTLLLSNGVKVILKPTDFRDDEVLLGAVRFGGNSLVDDADILDARVANMIVPSMGLHQFSPQELSKVLAGKSAAVMSSLGAYTDVINGKSGATDIETMLQLLWLQFQGVRRDEALFRSVIDQQSEVLRNQQALPERQFNDALMSALYNGHPRAPRMLTADDLARVNLDRSIALFRQRYASAKGMTFILAGSFDANAILPLLARYLGSLPTTDLPVMWRDTGLRPAKGVVKREVRSGSEPKSIVSLQFTGEANYSETAQLHMTALVQTLNMRLLAVLREQLGLIYGGGAQGAISKIPYGHYNIGIMLPTGPEHVQRVINATLAEIVQLRTQGPSADEMERVKNTWIQNHRSKLRENSYWVAHLKSTVTDGSDPATLLDIERRVQGLTAADVKAAAARYFDLGNYVQVVLNPEAAKAKAEAEAKPAAAREEVAIQ